MARIDLINHALMRIGAAPILSDLVPASAAYVAVYDDVNERLAAYPWTFGRQTRRLVRREAAPEAIYAYGYDLPAEMLGPPRAVYAEPQQRRTVTDYDIQGRVLLCDVAQVWLVLPGVSFPETWPGDFRELHRLALMAEYALSIREDRALHDRLYAKAFGTPAQNGMGGLLASCLENDAQATPGDEIGGGGNPLIDARA